VISTVFIGWRGRDRPCRTAVETCASLAAAPRALHWTLVPWAGESACAAVDVEDTCRRRDCGFGSTDDGDECIDVPEIKNGFKDEDGCPDEVPDTDKDGIPDTKDKCPKVPENINGFEDDDGCPDKGPSLVQITEGEIRILQKIEFATNSDKITAVASATKRKRLTP